MIANHSSKRASMAAMMMLSCHAALAGERAADADVGAAAGPSTPRWTVGGFGTLGVVRSNNDQADFTANVLSNTTTSGALTLRASLLRAHLSVDIARALFDGLREFGAQGSALAERYELSPKHAYVASVGFSYDPGHWFAMGEVGRMNTDSYLGDKTVGYLSAGYRLAELTPYVTYANSHANVATRVAGLDLRCMPAQQAAAGAALNAGLNQLLAAIPRQHTVSAGVRWDLLPNYALKLQADRMTPHHGSTGTFINVQPGFRYGQAIVVLSAALDFVF